MTQISCHLHDYIEIACLYHIKIECRLKNGDIIKGIGQTTRYNDNKKECLLIKTLEGNSLELELTRLSSMTALEPNRHFETISFES